MRHFIFILGREAFLAAAELQAVLKRGVNHSDFIVDKNWVTIKSADDEKIIGNLINILGGTIKIGVQVSDGNWQDSIVDDLEISPVRDVGISVYGEKFDRAKVFEIKSKSSKKIRLVLPKADGILNEAEIRANKLLKTGREYLVANNIAYKTLAVQDANAWAERDFGKPRSDAKSGMLPPKLARMMVNLAASQNQKSKIKDQNDKSKLKNFENCKLKIENYDFVVFDPFCGSGNVLIEAMMLGLNVVGSDISERAVEDTKENLIWLNQKLKIKNQNDRVKIKIEKKDATKLTANDLPKEDFVIVSEPWLGEPRRHKLTIEEEKIAVEEISKLYLDFLENFSRISNCKLQTANCRLSLVFPLFELANGQKLSIFEKIVDKIKNFGYIIESQPFLYGRDYQIVKRQIVLLNLKRKTQS
ncbi:MAG: hypothetical protein NTW79_01775 [Candidatus Berkelbacteria bacterium]|nr:hypothetical protein [Candidatus Berkelbacteria bacterium]